MIYNNKGISLASLIVTIIVLLILVTTTLSLGLGDNGIINKAKEARAKTNLSQAEEVVKTKILSLYALKSGDANIEDLKEISDNNIEVKYYEGSSTADVAYNKQYIFTIDNKFNISETREYSDNFLTKITPVVKAEEEN